MGELLSAWNSDVERYVKGINNSAFSTLLANEVLETLVDFCRETDIWSEFLSPITTVPGTAEYSLAQPYTLGPPPPPPSAPATPIEPTDGWARVWRVEQVWYKENGADPDQYSLLSPIVDWREDENGAYWRADTGPSPACYHHKVETQKLLVDPIPDVASTNGILVKASYVPSQTTGFVATKAPQFIYTRWKRGITFGICAGLMEMANKPWTDLKMSQYYRVKYLEIRDNAMETKQRGANRRASSAAPAAVARMGLGSRGRSLIY